MKPSTRAALARKSGIFYVYTGRCFADHKLDGTGSGAHCTAVRLPTAAAATTASIRNAAAPAKVAP